VNEAEDSSRATLLWQDDDVRACMHACNRILLHARLQLARWIRMNTEDRTSRRWRRRWPPARGELPTTVFSCMLDC